MVDWELDSESGFLFIKSGETNDCRIHEQVANIINSNLKQNSKWYQRDLQLLNDLRTDSLTNTQVINLEIITKLKKYVSLLNKLNEILPPESLKFTWNNNESSSIDWEIEHCLLQLSSYYSKLSISYYNDSSVESLKRAGIYFQYSAGCLNLLSNCNTSCMNLLLAQAQEIYYEKAILDNLKDSIISKLAIQIADYYYDDIQLNHFDDYINLKAVYFKCVSYFRYSNISKDYKKYGNSIAYLEKCQQLLNDNTINNSQYCKILQNFENLKIKILNNLRILKYENDMLYLNKIPKFKSLNELPRAILVKCLSPKEIELDSTFLSGLLPLHIINEIETYNLRFDEFIENEITTPANKFLDEIDNIVKNSNIIEKIKHLSDDELPTNIIEYRNELIKNGNIQNLNNLSNSLISLKFECKNKLNNVWKLLKDQLLLEESLAKTYGYDNWKLDIIDNDKSCSLLINSFKIYENYLKQGTENGDELIKVQINELIPFLKIFDNYNELVKYVPNSEYLKLNPNLNDCIQDIQLTLKDAKKFTDDIEKFLKNIRIKQEHFDLIKLYKSDKNVENLLKNEILKFETELKYIETFENRKVKLISEFDEKLLKFENLNNKLIISSNRLEALKVLTSTYNGYLEILENLNRGLEFYNNLNENLILKSNQLDQFLSKRNEIVNILREKFL